MIEPDNAAPNVDNVTEGSIYSGDAPHWYT